MALRVISGQFRRRILKTPSDDSTRPYTDRVRQIVFDRLQAYLPNARVADVFSGVGSMGIESLSRGAHSCVFFEADADIHKLLVENVKTIAPDARTICWRTDVRRTSFRPHGGDDMMPYTLIFFDPIDPGKPLAASLKRLARDTISTPDAILILRTPDHTEAPQLASWQIHDCWELSSMMIWILVKQPITGDDAESEDEVDESSSEDSTVEDPNDVHESGAAAQDA
jgi:16S rRNA (guanine966-N2)-methyltransferase